MTAYDISRRVLGPLALAALLGGATACDTKDDVPRQINDLVAQNDEFTLDQEKPLTKDREEQIGDPWTETEVIQNTGGESEVNTTWVTKREYYSALNHPDKFVLYNVNASVLWPGNLIQGNSIAGGVLNPIPITGEARTPINVFISVVTGSGGDYTSSIEQPTGSKVFQAMNDIVGQHYGSTPGQTSLEITRVYNMNHVMFNLNAGYSVPSTEISGALNINWGDEKQRVMVKFAQQYYSIAYDSPQDAEAVFSETVGVDDLAPFTSAANPMCYIDSVTFGRLFLFVYESSSSTMDLEASLNMAFNGMQSGSVEAAGAYQSVTENSTVRAYALGGNTQEALQVATDFTSLSDYLVNGAQLSADSPGAPISYTIRYLKNASIVRMNNTLEYTVDQATPVGPPVTEPTLTSFSVYLDHVMAVDQDDGTLGGGSEGMIGIRVFKFEDGSKTELYDTGLTCVYGQGEFEPNVTRLIQQTLSNQTVKNVSGNKIILQAYGYEDDTSDDHWFWIDKEFVYTYGATGNTWTLSSDEQRDDYQDLYYNHPYGGSQFLEFLLSYALTINGVTLN